ncbi:MAG: hypothetical protein JW984_07370 [Deltaproteobacteria bacterium]|uniref:Tetratricopeptide repeat protein n=1 Tax=Candidatus Zymogenus saltonus TaxID=2844893 RepID=A0A9D8KF79_9DELT|nr:hypothetical protein [Candidatus Zymogenus saltonus]
MGFFRPLAKSAIFLFIFIFVLTPSLAADESKTTISDLDILGTPSFFFIRDEFKGYDQNWFRFLTSLAEGSKIDAFYFLDELYNTKLNYGDKNVSYYSYSLLTLSRMMENEADLKTALRLIDESIRLSPDIARIHFYKASFLWRHNPLNKLFEITDHYVKGVQDAVSDIATYTALLGNLLIGLEFFILILFMLFAVTLAAKYIPLLSNDLKEKSGWEIHPMLFSVLILLFLIFISTLDLGFIWILFFLNLFFFVYYTGTEKKIAVVFYIFLLIAPVALEYTATMMLSTHIKATDEIVQIKNDMYTWDAERKLKSWVEENFEDKYALFTLGLLNKKTGYLSDALYYYNETLDIDENYAEALNNLGNIKFIQKDYEGAFELYKKSTSNNPNLVAPNYNLFKYYMIKFDQDEADKYHEKALELSHDRISKFAEIEIDISAIEPDYLALINRVVMDEDISDSVLWERVINSTDNKDLANKLWKNMMKGTTLRSAPVVGILAAVILFVIGTLNKRYIFSKACKFCGKPFFLKSHSHMEKRDACNRCFSLFIRREGVDPKTKTRLRMTVDRVTTRRSYIIRIVNILIPGFGNIYRGKTAKGFIFFTLYIFLLVQIFTINGTIVYPASSLGFPLIHNLYVYLFFLVIVYIIAQRDFFKSEISTI